MMFQTSNQQLREHVRLNKHLRQSFGLLSKNFGLLSLNYYCLNKTNETAFQTVIEHSPRDLNF